MPQQPIARRRFFTHAAGTAAGLTAMSHTSVKGHQPEADQELFPDLSLPDLHRSVAQAIADGRIGQPVFVRYLLEQDLGENSIVPWLASAAGAVLEWTGQSLGKVYAVGSLKSGQVSLTLQLKSGSTALVSFARSQGCSQGVHLLVLGNHGALTHDGNGSAADVAKLRSDAKLKALIAKAIRAGKPLNQD